MGDTSAKSYENEAKDVEVMCPCSSQPLSTSLTVGYKYIHVIEL